MAQTFDAIVIGGGPGGATAGLLLARAGWRVAVIEKSRFPRRKVCGEYISATNLPLFRRLGLEEDFLSRAGPAVRRVGLFAGQTILTASMPQANDPSEGRGRAMGRDRLDTLLLERAAAAGASIRQPWSATQLRERKDDFLCQVANKGTRVTEELHAPVVIAAHGSWEPGTLPTQPARSAPCCADLLAFKARFHDSGLPADLMPLFVFPGGYGGMVHTDEEQVNLSCCIRRDQLERCRLRTPGTSAAETVLAHIKKTCRGVCDALSGARVVEGWLSTGPIRPGIRARISEGIFSVGNAAGEAHPIIAEGISMAIQSSWLLCERLAAGPGHRLSREALREIGSDYAAAWRKCFASRVRAAALFAQLAMRPTAVEWLVPLFRVLPGLLTLGAKLSGKTNGPDPTLGVVS